MKSNSFNTLNHCSYKIRYHLVLVVNYRKKTIDQDILSRLTILTHERVEVWGGEVIEVKGGPDHLHILLEMPPTICLSDFVNALKTGTARRIQNEYKERLKNKLWGNAFWSRSYCIVSCGSAPLKLLKSTSRTKKVPDSNQYPKLRNEYWKENAAPVYLTLRFLINSSNSCDQCKTASPSI